VSGERAGKRDPLHDRQLLLLGAKRNAVLELWELQRYGADSYDDEDHVSIYGMRPAEWYAKGLRLLGRTAVECTRDALGDALHLFRDEDAHALHFRLPWRVVLEKFLCKPHRTERQADHLLNVPASR